MAIIKGSLCDFVGLAGQPNITQIKDGHDHNKGYFERQKNMFLFSLLHHCGS